MQSGYPKDVDVSLGRWSVARKLLVDCVPLRTVTKLTWGKGRLDIFSTVSWRDGQAAFSQVQRSEYKTLT